MARNTLFGTDGVRGQVNLWPMTPDVALKLGLAAGSIFKNHDRRHRVVIGKDTRISGYIFETALTSGLCAAGMDVFLVGPMPTPAISFLTRSMRADLGVVISASHNPFMDNGIKFFDAQGFKLPDEIEDRMAEMALDPKAEWNRPEPEAVGKAYKIEDARGRYIVSVKNSFPSERTLDGVKIVLDCAHGADYRVAPLTFEELGARVIRIGSDPNGININKKCGSLYPEVAAELVREHGADVGIALDGDGDRVILVDETGTVLDGDQIMAIVAADMMERGELAQNTLVATVMSNMALELFMEERGGKLLRTPVGDRHVVEAMRRENLAFGGEQSGHLIFMRWSTTGDGLLATLQVLRIMLEKGKRLSELGGLIHPFPQKLINVHVERKRSFDEVPLIGEAVREAQTQLGKGGRVLLRWSGTEPAARVMVEGQDEGLVERIGAELASVVKDNLK